ncbi:TPA: DNA polymerase III subunit delta' [Streptococcus suis]
MKIEELRQLQPNVFQRFVTTLEHDRLAHAYLFSGDFASFDMAIFLSQSLFCQEKSGVIPCQNCRSCRLIEDNEFADVTLIAPQGNIIKTDIIRELVKNFSQSGFESTKQVFIIRDAEKMHANAANALLKVIEEPQSDIHIFLLTNQEDLVLSTIKSRAQIIHFPKNLQVLERFLEEKGILRSQAVLLAQLVSSIEEATQLSQNKSFMELLGSMRKFVDKLLLRPDDAYLQVGSLVTLLPEKAEQGRVFDIISLLLAEQLTNEKARNLLNHCLKAKQMWQANVSLQNCLEYLTL